jgi:hypothetical protein
VSRAARRLREAPLNSSLHRGSAPPPVPSTQPQVQQPENPKALISQPDVTNFVGKPLLQDIMTWPVNFDNQSMLEAPKIKDVIAQRNLSLKLRAIASPIVNRTPD